jgi:hypothetical protein
MTSAINPNNIDGAYPVAGQDNNSQGFRDNFTNIKTNFQFARDEITQIQDRAVLKSALPGTQLNNNMNGGVISNAQLQDISQTAVQLGSRNGSVTLDYELGPYFVMSTAGSVSLGFSNLPLAGTLGVWQVAITVTNLAHTLTVPLAVGSGTALLSTNFIQGFNAGVITFDLVGTYVFEFRTSDGGASIFIEDLVRTTFFAGSNLVANNTTVFNTTSTNLLTANIIVANTAAIGNVTTTGNVSGNIVLGNTVVGGQSLFDVVSLTGQIRYADFDVFAANANVPLDTPITVITSSANIVGNIPAGAPGQIKTVAYGNSATGNTLLTVANAAWGGSNIANLSAPGSAATLAYVGNVWFCIGNNGVTFS